MSKYILPTYTGMMFDLADPTIDMIRVQDIAHHLSIENRYNGATIFPYSVAYHSLLVCRFAPDYLKLEALFHDAHEAYYKDLPSPLKQLLSKTDQIYESKCDDFDKLLATKFKLQTYKYKSLIKEIDLRMANTEIGQLLLDFPKEYWAHNYLTVPEPYTYEVGIEYKSPAYIEKMFISAFEEYRRDR